MNSIIFFVLCGIVLICGHGLKRANEQLSQEQKEILRKKNIWLALKRYTIPFGLALIFVFVIALIEAFRPFPLSLDVTFSIKIFAVAVFVITGIVLYRTHYYQLKALGFPNSYLRSLILYWCGFYIALLGIAFVQVPSPNTDEHEYFYWNSYWDPACSKCWPEPQTQNNNRCKPSDCILQGNYRCKPQHPPLSRSNDPRLIPLIKAGQCHFVR